MRVAKAGAKRLPTKTDHSELEFSVIPAEDEELSNQAFLFSEVLRTNCDDRVKVRSAVELLGKLTDWITTGGAMKNPELKNPDLIPFGEAPAHIPGRPNYITLWRWSTFGLSGVKLPTVMVGGRRFVSLAAIEKFLADVNVARATQRRAKQAAKRKPASAKR
jgi:hypothetical protein